MNQDIRKFGIYVLQQCFSLLDSDAREQLITRLRTQIPAIKTEATDVGDWATVVAPQVVDHFAVTYDPAKLRVAS